METSGYIPVGAESLYLWISQPEEGACRTGLLLVPPFGDEAKASVRLLTRLGRHLAANGVACARIDVRGSGDSTGEHGACVWSDWVCDVRTAAQWLATALPVPWGLLGVRLGGTLAAECATAMAVSRLALVEPVISGREYVDNLVRRRAIRAMMTGAEERSAGRDPDARWDAGGAVDFGGFEVNPALAEDLRGLSLPDSLENISSDVPVAVFRVAASERLDARWSALFDTLGNRPAGHAEVLRDKPFWGQIEYYESDVVPSRIADWLAGQETEGRETSCNV